MIRSRAVTGSDAVLPLDRLRTVTLDELVSAAELLTRVDRKYLLPAAAAADVVTALAPGARVLEIEGRRSFRYESQYFDTPGLDSYHLCARGRRRRFKVRRRTYWDTGVAFVEVKTRSGRDRTVKERVPAVDGVVGGLGPAGGFVDDALERAGVVGVQARDLRPGLVVTYRRTTLLLERDGCRVTVDTDLGWRLPGRPPVLLAGLTVVETKSGSTASSADRLLWSHGHRPVRISKYGTGLAVLRNELPGNRWHATVRRHLAPAL